MTKIDLADRLKQQAQIHAGESRCANSTIAEIYQLCTGATGEPGNWNGAEPVRNLVAERNRLKTALQRIRSLDRKNVERYAQQIAADVLNRRG